MKTDQESRVLEVCLINLEKVLHVYVEQQEWDLNSCKLLLMRYLGECICGNKVPSISGFDEYLASQSFVENLWRME